MGAQSNMWIIHIQIQAQSEQKQTFKSPSEVATRSLLQWTNQNQKCYHNRHIRNFNFKTFLRGSTRYTEYKYLETAQSEFKWMIKNPDEVIALSLCSGQIEIKNIIETRNFGPLIEMSYGCVHDILRHSGKLGQLKLKQTFKKPELFPYYNGRIRTGNVIGTSTSRPSILKLSYGGCTGHACSQHI